MVYELASNNVPGFKVIPFVEHITEDKVLEPFHKLKGKIREARKIAVTDCVCRKNAELLGHGCHICDRKDSIGRKRHVSRMEHRPYSL